MMNAWAVLPLITRAARHASECGYHDLTLYLRENLAEQIGGNFWSELPNIATVIAPEGKVIRLVGLDVAFIDESSTRHPYAAIVGDNPSPWCVGITAELDVVELPDGIPEVNEIGNADY